MERGREGESEVGHVPLDVRTERVGNPAVVKAAKELYARSKWYLTSVAISDEP
jgi:hypothetical protein